MSDNPCYFCNAPAPTPHGIHGCDDFDVCIDCRSKFITMRFFADPRQQELLGFECRSCGFTCDVPGKVQFNQDTGEFETLVDSMHNYCQNCGTASKR